VILKNQIDELHCKGTVSGESLPALFSQAMRLCWSLLKERNEALYLLEKEPENKLKKEIKELKKELSRVCCERTRLIYQLRGVGVPYEHPLLGESR
jgi:hypothetical protein